MTDTLTDTKIERWRLLWEEATTDTKWVTSNKERDAQRLVVQREMLDLLNSFLSEVIVVETLRDAFDRNTRTKWDVFGFKGMSGAMFLNKLVKHIPDSMTLSEQLRRALRVPSNPTEGHSQMQGFTSFLDRLITSREVTKRQIVPGYTPFFLSAWWHLQNTEMWPIFYKSGRKALERESVYAPTRDWVGDYFEFRECFIRLASALDLKSWELEPLLVWHGERDEISVVRTTRVEDEPATEESGVELSHAQIQWLLAKIGRKLGCRVWIAANDQNKEWNGQKLSELSIKALPHLGMDPDSQRIVSLIDVLWIKGVQQVVAAFEVELTTSVYSGLLRMSDLMVMSPNLSFPLYITAPEARLDKVRRELSRPTFQSLELHKQCGFFSFESLKSHADAIMQWATDPYAAIDGLASRVDDVESGAF